MTEPTAHDPLRTHINEVIFGYETPAGRIFDLALIILILLSVLAVLLDSVIDIQEQYHFQLYVVEWLFTILFTIEYGLRLYSSRAPLNYALSFYGLVDLCSILPSYISFFYPAVSYLLVIRILRVLRIFRILKLMQFMGEANILLRSLLASRRKILIFLSSMLALDVIFGSLMYLVEGPENGFTSIPVSIYWSIVTITTVGYGDIAPHTDMGRFIAAITMITGYAIIAVPTGIVSSELINEYQHQNRYQTHDFLTQCNNCGRKGHDRDANYCKQCGSKIGASPEDT